MKHLIPFTSILLIALTISCKKKDEEPFSEKFKVELTFKNWFDDPSTVLNYSGTSMTVASGTTVYVNTSFGGEEGTGEGIELASLEVTRTTASGTTTCLFTDKDNVNYSGLSEPIFENTTYTFKLTSASGEVATQGPFVVNVANDQQVLTFQDNLNAYSDTYKRFFSTSYSDNVTDNIYDLNGTVNVLTKNVNLRHIDFALTKDANNNLFLTSPTQFETLGMLPDYSAYSCNYRRTIFQTYTGTIDFSSVNSIFSENTLTFANLSNDLTITGTSESIPVVNGGHFMFQTAEGKKGIGHFKNVVAGASTDLIIVFQR
jgi:hypothetical protein